MGETALLTFIPLAVGGIGTCIAFLYLIINVSKFTPTEKIVQFTAESKKLNELVFKNLLDLLKKATKMNGGSGISSNISNSPVTHAAAYALNKRATDPIKEDTAALKDDTSAILNELKDIKANQQKLDQKYLTREEAQSLLEKYGVRSRSTSMTSLGSTSSNESQATLPSSAEVSRSNTPPVDPRDEKIAALQQELAENRKEVAGLKNTLTEIKASQLAEEKLANMLGKFLNPNNFG